VNPAEIRLSAIRTAIRASKDAQRTLLCEWAALNNAIVHENSEGAFAVIVQSAGRVPRDDEKHRVLKFWVETIFYGPAEAFIIKE